MNKAIQSILLFALAISLMVTAFLVYKHGNPFLDKTIAHEGDQIAVYVNYNENTDYDYTFDMHYSVYLNQQGTRTNLYYNTDMTSDTPFRDGDGEASTSVYYDFIEYINGCELTQDVTSVSSLFTPVAQDDNGLHYPLLVVVKSELDYTFYYTDSYEIASYCENLMQYYIEEQGEPS